MNSKIDHKEHVEAFFGTTLSGACVEALQRPGIEVYVEQGRTLVLVDREPVCTHSGRSRFRECLQSLGLSELNGEDDPKPVGHDVLHKVYSGLLAGEAVLLDEYVKVRNGVPLAVVHALARVNGVDAGFMRHQEVIAEYLGDE